MLEFTERTRRIAAGGSVAGELGGMTDTGRRGRRWPWALLLLVVVAGAVGGWRWRGRVEAFVKAAIPVKRAKMRDPATCRRLEGPARKLIQAASRDLLRATSGGVHNTLRDYLGAMGSSLAAVKRLQRELCPPLNAACGGNNPGPGVSLCLSADKVLKQVKAGLSKSAVSLLREADRHLARLRWCRRSWTPLVGSGRLGRAIRTLTRGCASVCGRRRRAEACRSCGTRTAAGLDLDGEARGRILTAFLGAGIDGAACAAWRGGGDPRDGGLHLGEYYWRVDRVLAYCNLLEQHGACGEWCRRTRKERGISLRLSSDPPGAQVSLRLWRRGGKEPSSGPLRALRRPVIPKADGKLRWLPAVVPKASGSAGGGIEWYLLTLRSGPLRGWFPLVPDPGATVSKTITLHSGRLVTDGRRGVRRARMLGHGGLLAWHELATEGDGRSRTSGGTDPCGDGWQERRPVAPRAGRLVLRRIGAGTRDLGRSIPLPSGAYGFSSAHWPLPGLMTLVVSVPAASAPGISDPGRRRGSAADAGPRSLGPPHPLVEGIPGSRLLELTLNLAQGRAFRLVRAFRGPALPEVRLLPLRRVSNGVIAIAERCETGGLSRWAIRMPLTSGVPETVAMPPGRRIVDLSLDSRTPRVAWLVEDPKTGNRSLQVKATLAAGAATLSEVQVPVGTSLVRWLHGRDLLLVDSGPGGAVSTWRIGSGRSVRLFRAPAGSSWTSAAVALAHRRLFLVEERLLAAQSGSVRLSFLVSRRLRYRSSRRTPAGKSRLRPTPRRGGGGASGTKQDDKHRKDHRAPARHPWLKGWGLNEEP